MRTTVILLLLLLAAAVAEAGQGLLTGTVKDESGGVVSGASVTIRSGNGRRATDGHRARRGSSASSRQPDRRPWSCCAGGFAEATMPVSGPGSVDVVLKPASVLDSVTVTPAKTEQRLADVPASVSIVDRQTIEQSPAVVSDDVLGWCRRSACSGARAACRRIRRRRACRCAASDRAASAGRWCCTTAFPSTTRSAAGSTGRACRSRASIASRWWTPRAPTSTATTPWAASSTSSATRAQPRTGEVRLQMGNLSSPKGDFFASDVWGKFGGIGRRQLLLHRRLPDRRRKRARADRYQGDGRLQEHQRQVRLQPVEPVERVLPRRLFHRRPQQRQVEHVQLDRAGGAGRPGSARSERHALEDGERRRPRVAAGSERSSGPRVRRLRDLPQ